MVKVNLSPERRQEIIDNEAKGIQDPDYMVLHTKLGIQVRKRKNAVKPKKSEEVPVHSEPVVEPPPPPKEEKKKKKDKSWKDDIQYYNLQSSMQMVTDNIKRIDEQMNKYKEKQKKLKGKYKKLKKFVTEDDEDIMEISKPIDEVPVKEEEPVKKEEPKKEEEPPQQYYAFVGRPGPDFSYYMRH